MAKRVEIAVGDRVSLSRTHPCGSNEWTVVRVGADIGLTCAGCGRKVMLTRSEFNRAFMSFVDKV